MKMQGYSYMHVKTPKTNERKSKMLEMHNNGFTYSEIGKAFNLSRQRVYQIIGKQSIAHFKEITPDQCVYPNLRKWMNDNRISQAELNRKVFGANHPSQRLRVGNFLKGRTVRIEKQTIDKYLMATGLTYEELFETEGGE